MTAILRLATNLLEASAIPDIETMLGYQGATRATLDVSADGHALARFYDGSRYMGAVRFVKRTRRDGHEAWEPAP
jgi:hypothetical protein